MVKSLELLSKLNKLEKNETVDEAHRGLYVHRGLHAVHKSPLAFSQASKEDMKKFGKDTIIHHNVNPNGIVTKTHAIMPSKMSAGGFEHHYIEYHASGAKAGQEKSRTVKNFNSQKSAVDHANKSDLHRLASRAKEKAVAAATTKAKQLLSGTAKSASKALLKSLSPHLS